MKLMGDLRMPTCTQLRLLATLLPLSGLTQTLACQMSTKFTRSVSLTPDFMSTWFCSSCMNRYHCLHIIINLYSVLGGSKSPDHQQTKSQEGDNKLDRWVVPLISYQLPLLGTTWIIVSERTDTGTVSSTQVSEAISIVSAEIWHKLRPMWAQASLLKLIDGRYSWRGSTDFFFCRFRQSRL